MGSVPRQHHYVPQALLKGFTQEGTETGTLQIFDLVRNKTYASTPKGTGKEKDYNLVEVPGRDPAAIEHGLLANNVEGPAGPAMEKVRAGQPLDEEDQQRLLIFMAAQALRAPGIRETFEAFSTQIAHNDLRLRARHDDEFRENLEKDPDFAGMTPEEAVEEYTKNARLKWSSTDHLRVQLPAFGPILDLLARRSWIVLTSSEDFICTDRPVVMLSPDGHPRGFASTDAKVFMPIGYRHGLLGVWAENRFWRHQEPDAGIVAFLNTALLLQAGRFVASRTDHFLWREADGTMTNRAALVARGSVR
jgi:hypothetical protein